MIILTREEATKIAHDLGVYNRPVQFWQGELSTKVQSLDFYLYVGFVYIASIDQNTADNIRFLFQGEEVGRLINNRDVGLVSGTTQQNFYAFDEWIYGVNFGRAYFCGYRFVR